MPPPAAPSRATCVVIPISATPHMLCTQQAPSQSIGLPDCHGLTYQDYAPPAPACCGGAYKSEKADTYLPQQIFQEVVATVEHCHHHHRFMSKQGRNTQHDRCTKVINRRTRERSPSARRTKQDGRGPCPCYLWPQERWDACCRYFETSAQRNTNHPGMRCATRCTCR